MKTFVLPGVLKRQIAGKRCVKPMPVSLFLEAENREDALWQAHHGVIEANVSASFPNATVKYDLRKLTLQS